MGLAQGSSEAPGPRRLPTGVQPGLGGSLLGLEDSPVTPIRAMAAHSPPLMPNNMLGMRYEELTLKDAQDYEKNLSDHDRGVSMRNLAAQCLV